ncbi:MAG TPA: trypsin-like peptidase domain-containing protein [Spirochaetota bacterium]|nr:trypsin-like peptidase domain-containing protein [Spirochaetota bacterium]HOR92589.1 trypsin-like peptidase domain-containing protein [Spirochaetota bacterium]HOT19295.1 trypsin-like peptidase domain-containing protein [Spirochaetota bacterium]HPD04011.1 trypsin-like peptidase domain-containing protein [Spirochaetota bacterium]HQI37911.1 trypsin-like peptidase domain-containing protein [Spirochaetota bacterium]
MKKLSIIAALIFFQTLVYGDNISQRFIAAADKAGKAVVSIQVFVVEKGHYQKVGYASGTIISSKGLVVTNYHVVAKGTVYQVNLCDGTECDVEPFADGSLFKADEKTDIALLKVKHSAGLPLTPIEFEDKKVFPGQWVMAIGNPFGLQQSVTAGVVSSLGRSDIGFADIEDYIQTDVPINPGNSGGPLISLDGKLIGINTAIRTQSGGYQGISFAIPAFIVKQVVGELVQYGRVRRGWLGFLVQEKMINNNSPVHVEIISIVDGSPAYKAGIEVGDIVREVDGIPIKKISDLMKAIHSKQIGSLVNIVIARDGQLLNFDFVLQEKSKISRVNYWINVLQQSYGITIEDTLYGAVITGVNQFGIAYNVLKKGDIIQSINDKQVTSLDDIIAIVKKTKGTIENCVVLRSGKVIRCYFNLDGTE